MATTLRSPTFTALLLAAAACAAAASPALALDPGTITVQVNKPAHPISPTLYGLMTEEINHSYDGGLYAELIQNRTFQDPYLRPRAGRGRGPAPASAPAPDMVGEGEHAVLKSPLHWALVASNGAQASFQTDLANPVNPTSLPASLRIHITDLPPGARAGAANLGYWGIPVLPNTTYTASFYAKAADGLSGPLTVDIEPTAGGAPVASASLPALTGEWKKYTLTLKTDADAKPTADARFVLSAASKGDLWLSDVSLFPPTYKNRPNGNRMDISKLLADMDPAFLRFPGGNYLEGETPETRFNWKKMIGPVEDRPGHMGTWQYRSSDGFGLDEFLGWCQDLHMMPVLAVYAGYSLGGQHITGDDLKPYIQEALDEIEYVSGDASTHWGAIRAKNGYPKPFDLKYVEIGNEDQFDARRGPSTYDERFAAFHDAIKAKYPNLQLIATTPVKGRTPDVVDDHYYKNSRQMWAMSQIYDKKDRNGPKIFVGEWATREGSPTPNMNAALGDAAFLTGLERNSDLVVMSCYAPLFVNVSDPNNPNPSLRSMEWPTDLIGFNALSAYGSPAYYVQKMFIHNKGDDVLPVTIDLPGSDGGVMPYTPPAQPEAGRGPARNPGPMADGGVFVEASKDNATSEVILKIVNAQASAQTLKIDLQGVKGVDNTGIIQTLQGEPTEVNTIAEPEKVAPKTEGLPVPAPTFTRDFPAHSVSVLRIKVK